ncbi:flavodoxin family protein [Acutalibacter sp. JLR.KK004]|uniref:flavodoxin family protein n=1 Tax=Acutalibacter sp. JLR.KK004 TaxID=3112622 RepID=UPI002FF3E400
MRILLLNLSPKNYGATQEILKTLQEAAPKEAETELVCLGDWDIRYCKGCKACYKIRACVVQDDMRALMDKVEAADVLVLAAPSYWADVPGVCKSFIDRCTPYSDTNPDPDGPRLRAGKRCYGIALRTGVRPMECEHILGTIEHWCGHMGITFSEGVFFCQIEGKSDITPHKPLLREKAGQWFKKTEK